MFKLLLSKYIHALIGSPYSRKHHEQETFQHENPEQAFNFLTKIMPPELANEQSSPIFIFSAGWRSGSTLLQRLTCSDKNFLMYGEPYDKCNLIPSLADSITPLSSKWPHENYFIGQSNKKELSDRWIANLYPDTKQLLLAHKSFLHSLFSKPATELGFKRWGIKEVRFGLKEALYLKALYPNAKFLYLTRELKPAYQSYINYSKGSLWYDKWPYKPIKTAYAFAKHRASLIKEFEKAIKITGGLRVKYEELCPNNDTLNQLESYCEISINKSILKNKIGSGKDKENINPINTIQKFLLCLGDR